ncbi:MAG: ImmA/IrrE family metallo-endopeptidase [Dehalococcoidia bacterium]
MIRSRESRQRAKNILEMFRVNEPPTDVHGIAGELGFMVIPYDFPEDTSAMLLIREDAKVIGVNENHAEVRQRFSIAHELGHYLNGHEDFTVRGGQEKIRVDGEFDFTDPQQRREQEANEFAAELLMPESMLKRDIAAAGRLDVPALTKRYNVSEQAMWIQLIDLKLASQYAAGS